MHQSSSSSTCHNTVYCFTLRYVFLIMLQQLGWKRVGALMEDGARFSDYVAALQDQAERNNVTFVVIRKMMSNSSVEVGQHVIN